MPRDRNATRRGERWRSVHETICWLLLIRACAPRPSVNHPARARQARTTSQPGQPQPGWFACRALMPRLTFPRSHLAFFPFFADRLGHARARSRTHDRRAFAGRGGVAGRGRRRPAGLTEPFPAPGPNGVDGGRGGRVWRAPLPKQAERDRRQAAVLPLSLSLLQYSLVTCCTSLLQFAAQVTLQRKAHPIGVSAVTIPVSRDGH